MLRKTIGMMALKEVLDRKFSTGQHMVLCMAEVVNCGMGVDYTLKHGELMPFV
jgi:hypothetical protein